MAPIRPPAAGTDAGLDALAELLRAAVGAPVALVALATGERLRVAGAAGIPHAPLPVDEIAAADPLRRVAGGGGPLVVDDSRGAGVTPSGTAGALGARAYAAAPVTDGDGAPLGVVVALDTEPRPWSAAQRAALARVAALAATHAALRRETAARHAAEARLRTFEKAVDAMQLGVTICDPDGTIVFTNPAEAAMHGYTVDELLGRPARELAPSDQWGDPRRPHGAGSWTREAVNVRRDGVRFPVLLWSDTVRDPDGTPRAVVTCCEDLTGRRETEAALRRSEERLAAIVASATDAILSVGEDQRIVVFNAAAERMFGVPADEAIGSSLARFLPARFRAAHTWHVAGYGAGGGVPRAMRSARGAVAVRASGEEFPIEAAISRVQAGGQTVYTAIIRDVGEARRTEEELTELVHRELAAREMMNAVLARVTDAFFALDEEGRFTYANPRAEALCGRPAAELLGERIWDALPEVARSPLELHLRRAARTGQPVQAEFFQEPLGKWLSLHVHPSGNGLSAYVQDVTERREGHEALRRSEDLLRSVVEGIGDGISLRDAGGRSLLANTAHARLHGCPPERLAGGTPAELYPPAEAERMAALDARVLADGRPWSAEEEVGAPGARRRVHSTRLPFRDRSGRVTGVLQICRDVTAQRALEERLRDSVGRALAERADSGAPTAPHAVGGLPLPEPRGGGETVLLAEDDAALRSLVRTVLAQGGYRVLEAADGTEALATAAAHPDRIDLLLSDVVMPGMRGFGLAERLLRARPGVRVLLMSGFADEVRGHGDEHAWSVLAKPVDPSDLLDRVRATLDGG